jgi:hypothetical protein
MCNERNINWNENNNEDNDNNGNELTIDNYGWNNENIAKIMIMKNNNITMS